MVKATDKIEVILLDKSAQGMSLNTIVIAALVVLVMVILSAIFMGRMGIFTQIISDCPAECVEPDYMGNCPGDMTPISGYDCPGTMICCEELGGDTS